jgi:hypothetical protein
MSEGKLAETIKAESELVNYYEHKHGKSSKVHMIVTAKSLPLNVVVD